MPIFGLLSFMALAFYGGGRGSSSEILSYSFWVIVVYIIWLIAMGRYIFPHKSSQAYKLKDYLPLSLTDSVQTFLVICHTFIYIALLIWLAFQSSSFESNSSAQYNFILESYFYASCAATFIAILSTLIYILPKILRLAIGTPALLTNLKLNAKSEQEKLNELLDKHDIPRDK
ncbi:MAG: hypothetical protein OCD03_14985 [Hyphomicrobiales bacterium]